MSLPTNLGAYTSEISIYERAADSATGIRLRFDTYNAAVTYRSRLNYARSLLRRQSTMGVEPDAPTYNRSEFDHLVNRVRREADAFYVYITPSAGPIHIEEIPLCPPSTPSLPSPTGTPLLPKNTESVSPLIRRILSSS